MLEMRVASLGQEDPLEKEMANCSSISAWEIPRTEETGGLLTKQQTTITDHTTGGAMKVAFSQELRRVQSLGSSACPPRTNVSFFSSLSTYYAI